jgi:hypothetical protein
MPTAFRGYSYTGACAMYAILGEGDAAITWLDRLLACVNPNTLYDEGGNHCTETPLSAVDSLDYLLLQSWGDTIRVFPAVPTRWRDVSFTDFSAEGAFLVSAQRRDGETTWVKVQSLAGRPLRLRPNLPDGPFTIDAPKTARATLTDGLIEATLAPGEILLVRAGQ